MLSPSSRPSALRFPSYDGAGRRSRPTRKPIQTPAPTPSRSTFAREIVFSSGKKMLARNKGRGEDHGSAVAPRWTVAPDGRELLWSDGQLYRAERYRRACEMKSVAFKAFRWLGVSVRRARKYPALIDFLENRRVSVVYDVGANVGQFGLALRRRGYQGRIVSVEPVKDAFDRLKQIAAADGNWEATRCAIGASEGQLRITVSRNSQFSSVKRLAAMAASIDPNSEFVGAECVDISPPRQSLQRLWATADKDRYPGLRARSPRGAPIALSRAVGVLMELPIINLYDNHWYVTDALDHMRDLGFVLCQSSRSGIIMSIRWRRSSSIACSGGRRKGSIDDRAIDA